MSWTWSKWCDLWINLIPPKTKHISFATPSCSSHQAQLLMIAISSPPAGQRPLSPRILLSNDALLSISKLVTPIEWSAFYSFPKDLGSLNFPHLCASVKPRSEAICKAVCPFWIKFSCARAEMRHWRTWVEVKFGTTNPGVHVKIKFLKKVHLKMEKYDTLVAPWWYCFHVLHYVKLGLGDVTIIGLSSSKKEQIKEDYHLHSIMDVDSVIQNILFRTSSHHWRSSSTRSSLNHPRRKCVIKKIRFFLFWHLNLLLLRSHMQSICGKVCFALQQCSYGTCMAFFNGHIPGRGLEQGRWEDSKGTKKRHEKKKRKIWNNKKHPGTKVFPYFGRNLKKNSWKIFFERTRWLISLT